MAETLNDVPIMFFDGPAPFKRWLERNYADPKGIWLKMAKKASGITSVNYDQALRVALCYGWIDGQLKSFDADYYLQKFTPRRRGSLWSKRNIGIVEGLIADGSMEPPGLAEIEAAKQDGRWGQAYDSASAMQVPKDFLDALKKQPKAATFFETLDKTNRYAVLWRIQTAKTEALRQKRIEALVAMLAEGKTIHQKAS